MYCMWGLWAMGIFVSQLSRETHQATLAFFVLPLVSPCLKTTLQWEREIVQQVLPAPLRFCHCRLIHLSAWQFKMSRVAVTQDHNKRTCGLTSQNACWPSPRAFTKYLLQYWFIITRVSCSSPASSLRDHSSAGSHFDVPHSLSSLALVLIVLWLKQPFPIWASMVIFAGMLLGCKQAKYWRLLWIHIICVPVTTHQCSPQSVHY